MKKLLLLLPLLFACSDDANPTTPIIEPSETELRLVWSDEFNTPGKPDPSKWQTVHGKLNWCNSDEYYTPDANATVSDTTLKITARKEEYWGAQYTSAMLSTRDLANWTYGRFEIRAKVPSGRGVHPAIWLKPQNERFGGDFMSGEIDIMEHYGFAENSAHGTIHTGKYNMNTDSCPSSSVVLEDIETAFHVYAVDWTPDSIAFYVDSTHYFTYKNQGNGIEEWPFDYPFFIYLNVAVGGDWAGSQGIDESSFPQTMEIDYVRVYQMIDLAENYTITTLPMQNGSITLSGDSPFPSGQHVAVTAVPAAGYEFHSWQGTITGTENPLNITMDRDHQVSALFQRTGNSVENPDFLFGFRDWEMYTLTDTVDTVVHSASADTIASTDSVEISVTDGGLNLWSVMFLQKRLMVEKGKEYQVLFRAKASKSCTIRAKLQKVSDYSEYGGLSAQLTTAKQTFTFPCTISEDDQNASLVFDLGVDSTQFTFYEVNLIEL